MPYGLALENVVNWREKRGDDHDGDSDVVHLEEEEVEVVGVAAEEVAGGGGEEAE